MMHKHQSTISSQRQVLSHSLSILSLISATNEIPCNLCALRTLSASMRP